MLEEIAKYDKDFLEGTFLTKVDHIFIMILDAIMDNDMSSVKHFLSENIYLTLQEKNIYGDNTFIKNEISSIIEIVNNNARIIYGSLIK